MHAPSDEYDPSPLLKLGGGGWDRMRRLHHCNCICSCSYATLQSKSQPKPKPKPLHHRGTAGWEVNGDRHLHICQCVLRLTSPANAIFSGGHPGNALGSTAMSPP